MLIEEAIIKDIVYANLKKHIVENKLLSLSEEVIQAVTEKLSGLFLDINLTLESDIRLISHIFDGINSDLTVEDFHKQYYQPLEDFANKNCSGDAKESLLDMVVYALTLKGCKEKDLHIITNMFFNEKSMFEADLDFDGPKSDDLFNKMIQEATKNILIFENHEIDRIKESSLEDLSTSLQEGLKFLKNNHFFPKNKP